LQSHLAMESESTIDTLHEGKAQHLGGQPFLIVSPKFHGQH
jgi:hypothetical protein